MESQRVPALPLHEQGEEEKPIAEEEEGLGGRLVHCSTHVAKMFPSSGISGDIRSSSSSSSFSSSCHGSPDVHMPVPRRFPFFPAVGFPVVFSVRSFPPFFLQNCRVIP